MFEVGQHGGGVSLQVEDEEEGEADGGELVLDAATRQLQAVGPVLDGTQQGLHPRVTHTHQVQKLRHLDAVTVREKVSIGYNKKKCEVENTTNLFYN